MLEILGFIVVIFIIAWIISFFNTDGDEKQATADGVAVSMGCFMQVLVIGFVLAIIFAIFKSIF